MTNRTPRRSAVQSPEETDPERTAAMEPIAPAPPGAGEAAAAGQDRAGTTPDGRLPGERAQGPRSWFAARGGPTSVAEREAALAQTVPVASFPNYGAAADAVARLGGAGFPIEQITIVGCDLRLIEEITGRMNLPRAAALGAISGAWFGALVAALVGIFAGSFGAFLALLLWGIVLGAVFGAGLGILGYISFDRSRGFTSDRLVVAGRYDLHAPTELADQLRAELLAHRPSDVRIIDGHPVR